MADGNAVAGCAGADARRRTGRAFLGWAAVYTVSQANIARTLGSAAPKLLKIQTATSAAGYREVLDSMTPRELAGYRAHYPLDMAHPFLYAMALRAGARALHARRRQPEPMRRFLMAAPVVSAGCDYVENVAGWYLIDHRERVTDAGTRVVTAVSTLKWVLALGELGHVLSGLAVARLRRH
ncbi:hypothetical protein [Tomitella gaofuii]|uniref:hypothetical protein n=1 Tax=Tomitella gaofuii TaxID=2760083 RepID=UPI001F255BF0|nr:hypothetical protein [Tomitella gaofuii]